MSTAQAITTDILVNNHTQKAIFKVLISSLIVLSIVYVYLIGSITFDVLARRALETTVRNVGTHISELELSYLDTANTIDKNYASTLGYVEIKTNIFATRGASRVAMR
jgi:hypothetical protein